MPLLLIWPRPSGLSGDGPTGSWTTPFSANRSSQASRLPSLTYFWDRSPARRAGCSSDMRFSSGLWRWRERVPRAGRIVSLRGRSGAKFRAIRDGGVSAGRVSRARWQLASEPIGCAPTRNPSSQKRTRRDRFHERFLPTSFWRTSHRVEPARAWPHRHLLRRHGRRRHQGRAAGRRLHPRNDVADRRRGFAPAPAHPPRQAQHLPEPEERKKAFSSTRISLRRPTSSSKRCAPVRSRSSASATQT